MEECVLFCFKWVAKSSEIVFSNPEQSQYVQRIVRIGGLGSECVCRESSIG